MRARSALQTPFHSRCSECSDSIEISCFAFICSSALRRLKFGFDPISQSTQRATHEGHAFGQKRRISLVFLWRFTPISSIFGTSLPAGGREKWVFLSELFTWSRFREDLVSKAPACRRVKFREWTSPTVCPGVLCPSGLFWEEKNVRARPPGAADPLSFSLLRMLGFDRNQLLCIHLFLCSPPLQIWV